jgi:hypothetical protein
MQPYSNWHTNPTQYFIHGTVATNLTLTPSSRERIAVFIDEFIRSEYVEIGQYDPSQDFSHNEDRATRCLDAAKHGADGSTHAEQIEDWRVLFQCYMDDIAMTTRQGRGTLDRFTTAVEQYWDDLETWHETHGSLHDQIG